VNPPETILMQDVLRERLALAAWRADELERRNAELEAEVAALRAQVARLTDAQSGGPPAPPR